MGFYVMRGGSNYIKVKDQQSYELLLAKYGAYDCLPNPEGKIRYEYLFCDHWPSGSLYFFDIDDNDNASSFELLDKVAEHLMENETFLQLYSTTSKGSVENCLKVAIVQAGKPVIRLDIEPEIAALWKVIIDEFVSINRDAINKLEELEGPRAKQKEEIRQEKLKAKQAREAEERKKWLIDHPEMKDDINDEDLPF